MSLTFFNVRREEAAAEEKAKAKAETANIVCGEKVAEEKSKPRSNRRQK